MKSRVVDVTRLEDLKTAVKNSPLGPFFVKLKRKAVQWVPKTNSAMCWVKEDDDHSTVAYLYNYWLDNYKVPRVLVRYTLFDAEGAVVAEGEFPLEADASARVRAGDVLRAAGRTGPFEGNLVFSLRDRRLASERVVQFNVDYMSRGSVSTVHGQGHWVDYRRPSAYSHFHLVENAAAETWVVLQNPFRYQNSPYEMEIRPEIQVFNRTGDRLSAEAGPVPACGSQAVSLARLFPGLANFLDGGDGAVRVLSPVTLCRVLFYHVDKASGRWSVNHATRDEEGAPLMGADLSGRVGWGPSVHMLLMHGADWSTRYVLQNHALDGPLSLDIRVWNAEGRFVLEKPGAVVLPLHGTKVVTSGELLAAQGSADFQGHVGFSLTPGSSGSGFPYVLNAIQELCHRGFEAATAVGSDIFNSRVPSMPFPVEWIGAFHSTKTFSRVVEDEENETWLALINPSSDPGYSSPSRTTLFLYDKTGTRILKKDLTVPPQGSVVGRLKTFFPDLASFLKPDGFGALKVRDRQSHLFGYHILMNRRSGAVAADHLFGG
jgi:hypothetical protein